MKPEEQRIAIAEAVGKLVRSKGMTNEIIIKHRIYEELPDYLNDLNACHEMEKSIIQDEPIWILYYETLIEICELVDDCLSIHATPAQRCEAFLKAIGKYKE